VSKCKGGEKGEVEKEKNEETGLCCDVGEIKGKNLEALESEE